MARAVKSRVSKVVKQAVKSVRGKVTATKKTVKAVLKAKMVAAAPPKMETKAKKTVSERLLETIEKRKLAKRGGLPQKPPGRRGRRPKNVEYTPTNNEEDSYVLEPEFERLEYDTGIRLKEGSDDKSFNLERFEDFDEELNFDW